MVSQKFPFKSSPVDLIFENFEGLNFLNLSYLAKGGLKRFCGCSALGRQPDNAIRSHNSLAPSFPSARPSPWTR